MRAVWLCLTLSLAAGCGHQLVPAVERELDLVGRFMDAKHMGSFRYRLRRERSPNPLDPSTMVYAVEGDGGQLKLEIECSTSGPTCHVSGMPAIDQRSRSRAGRQLVALWKAMVGHRRCGDNATVEIQHAPHGSGSHEFRVRGCGHERSYDISYDITCNEKHCMTYSWGNADDSNRDRRLRTHGVTYERCFEGAGIARMEPLGSRLEADGLTDHFQELWSAYRHIPGVRTAGLGECCLTLEHGWHGWCLRLFIERDFEAAIDAIAATAPPNGLPRPPVMIDKFQRDHN